jgi:hypothetical protein
MGVNLYELTDQYRKIQEIMEDATDEEVVKEMQAALGDLDDPIEKRVEAIVKIVKQSKANRQMLDEVAKEAKARSKRMEGREESIRGYLQECMKAADIKRVDMALFGPVTRQDKPPWVRITDEDAVGEEFRVPQPSRISKTAIREWIDETGKVPAGCELVTGEEILVIR